MKLRSACPEDFSFYYKLKCEPSAVYWGGFAQKPDRMNLKQHFDRLIAGQIEDRDFYICEDDGKTVGYLQLTHNSAYEIEIGYGVSETFRGKGYGVFILSQAKKIITEMGADVVLIGYIRDDNEASKRCFEKNGFMRIEKYDERFFAMDNAYKKMYAYIFKST